MSTIKTISKKAIAYIVGLILVVALFLITLFVIGAEGATAIVPIFATTIGAIVLLTFAFIGGRLWKDYIRSAYFRPELDGQ